jgi:hypothetical protein
MKKTPPPLPVLMGELVLASWETIFRRSLMMMQGTCSIAEYQRMISEKTIAAQQSAVALMTGGSHHAIIAPYCVRARANARRLRRS